jgi:hypothetical protein
MVTIAALPAIAPCFFWQTINYQTKTPRAEKKWWKWSWHFPGVSLS